MASSLVGVSAMANSPKPLERGGGDAAAGLRRRAAFGPSEPGAAPPGGIDTSVFEPAFARIAEGAPIVMVLGGAGTGKTVFLHELRRRGGMRQVFLAPTGVAALQLGGQTIHSFFGIPPRILNPDEIKPRSRARKLLRKIDRLVVDEVSMVRCDLLDVMDRCLRLARERPEPFGGVQMILVGDFLQLPPVVPYGEQAVLACMGFTGPYAFNAKVLHETPVARVPFTVVHRQTDQVFVQHLDQIRRGERVVEAIDALNAACCRDHRPQCTPVVLAPTNARVDSYNHRGLALLKQWTRPRWGRARVNSIWRATGCRSPRRSRSRSARG